jgi:hypothetical protein
VKGPGLAGRRGEGWGRVRGTIWADANVDVKSRHDMAATILAE